MVYTKINTQILNEIINAITTSRHTIIKLWILKSLEHFADKIEVLKPIYEALLKSDFETFVIYESMAPEPIAKILKEIKHKALEEDEELRKKFVKLVEETINEYIPSTKIRLLFDD